MSSPELTITPPAMAALFGTMALLAAIPSVSVLAVAARAVSGGFVHGALAAAGVVVGDLFFIVLAMFGLALMVEVMGETFVLVRYLGGAYLIWLGVSLWRSPAAPADAGEVSGASRWSSFMTGLLVTLGDQKAVLFYLGFLPAFVDLDAMSHADAVIVGLTATVAVGGVKLAYAAAAGKAGRLFGGGAARVLSVAAACVMIAAGVAVILMP